MKGSTFLLFGPVDKKSHTNLCWMCKEVSHSYLGPLLWRVLRVYIQIHLYITETVTPEREEYMTSCSVQTLKRTLKLCFQFLPLHFEFNPGCWLKTLSLALFYNGSISPVFWFLLHWRNQKSLSPSRHRHPLIQSDTKRIPFEQNQSLWLKIWLFVSFDSFYHRTCPWKEISVLHVPESSIS